MLIGCVRCSRWAARSHPPCTTGERTTVDVGACHAASRAGAVRLLATQPRTCNTKIAALLLISRLPSGTQVHVCWSAK